jgi:bifunctional non-homologous end joining protein LigD
VPSRTPAGFIEPMLLQQTDRLPTDGGRWAYELKLDGYRAIAANTGAGIRLWSRSGNDFTKRYASIARGLAKLPPHTVLDGEVVALDDEGRPSFNALQNADANAPLVYFVFDVLVLRGRDVRHESFEQRRARLERHVLPTLAEPVRYTGELTASLRDLLASVKAQGFEGLVAKRRDSWYEAGQRSGAWQKMRVNRGQEFVIGGYTIGTNTFDAVIVGYYDGDRLIYAARTRNGFTPAVRTRLMNAFRPLETRRCPFANLPEARSGRWGQGLTQTKMAGCRWLRPELVAQIEFVEWTADDHLRHARFIGLREDKVAHGVIREPS